MKAKQRKEKLETLTRRGLELEFEFESREEE